MQRPFLFKRRGSRWTVRFQVPDGLDDAGRPKYRTITKACRTTNKTKAARIADEIYQEALKEAAYLTGDRQRDAMGILRKAVEATVKDELSEPMVRQWLADLYEIAHGSPLALYTVRRWFEAWEERKAMSASAGTMVRYRRSNTLFLDFLGEKADRRLELVATSDIRAFQQAMREKHGTARTTNNRVRDIGAVFGQAVRDQLILANPTAGVAPLPERDSITREPLTEDELKALFATLKGGWRVLAGFGLYAGLRINDAAKVKWDAVDLDASTLTVTVKKTGKTIVLPLPEPLRDLLLELPASDDPTAYVLPEIAALPTGGYKAPTVVFGKMMDAAGIDRKAVDEKGKRQVPTKSFHSLRHSFVSMLANSNVPEELRMQLAGHHTRSSHQIYTAIELETLKRAVSTLPKFGK